MTDACDVLVVGGGPAGSTLAWRLRRQGLDVLLIDRQRFPRDKSCAGWITPAVVRELELDLDDYRRGRVLQPIHGFRIALPGGRATRTGPSDRPRSFGIRRCEFDHYLLERSGARVRGGCGLREMSRVAGGWLVNGEIRARLLVGAGGHFCPVARRLDGRADRARPTVCAQEVEFEMQPSWRAACPVDPAVPELFFCDDLRGYGWVFRKGNHLNVGLGREDPHRLSAHVAAFRERLISEGRLPGALPERFRGHAYLLYPRGRRELVDDGVLLVGDAAGLAYPESGEGIRPAIESSLLAADVIAAAAGDYRRERLAPYAARLTRRFGARRARERGLRLPQRLERSLARRLLGMRWFVERVVVARWFLHEHEPAFPG
jgi:geranylgeranyl reductase family protein